MAIITKKFRQILKKANCLATLERRASFHCLRHTFASVFMRNAGNINELQKLLGHCSIAMTEKYAHFATDYLKGATERVSFGFTKGTVLSLDEARRLGTH